jgi:hypothetical protein
MGRDLTNANSVIMLAIAGLYDSPQQLQGYAADDVFSAEQIDMAETQMGVDGKLSAGFIFVPQPWSITLQADSDSNDIFDNWTQAQIAAKAPYFASGTVMLPSVGKKWAMVNGVLTKFTPMPAGKKILQPRQFTITFENISPAPV